MPRKQKKVRKVSGSRELLPAPSPLRTVRASFPAHGSSIPKANPCRTTRLFHSRTITQFLILKHKPSILEVLLIFRVIGVRGSSDFNVSCYLHPAWVKKLIDAVTSLSLPNFHRKGPRRLSAHPVLLNKPILALSRMFSAHPLPQAVINIITYNIFCRGVFQVIPSTPGVRLPLLVATRLTASNLA